MIGSFSGLLVGLSIQWWKSGRDDRKANFEEFCKTVRRTTDIGSEYWLSSTSDKNFEKLQALIFGAQIETVGLAADMKNQMLKTDKDLFGKSLAQYVRALTGSSYGNSNDKSSPELARNTQMTGADLVVTSRKVLANRNKLFGSLKWWIG
jgi:hypothetical protein